jgi:hypothetical protein
MITETLGTLSPSMLPWVMSYETLIRSPSAGARFDDASRFPVGQFKIDMFQTIDSRSVEVSTNIAHCPET